MSLGATTVFAHPDSHTYGAAPENVVFAKYNTGMSGFAGCGCGPRYALQGLDAGEMSLEQSLKGLAFFGAITLGAFALIGALKKGY